MYGFLNEKIFGNYLQIIVEYHLCCLKILRVGEIVNLILKHSGYIDIQTWAKLQGQEEKSSLFLEILMTHWNIRIYIYYCKGNTRRCESKGLEENAYWSTFCSFNSNSKQQALQECFQKKIPYCLSLWGLYFGYEREEERPNNCVVTHH